MPRHETKSTTLTEIPIRGVCSQLESLGKKPHSGRAKVKSGCKTCKTRKVKCDEGLPACRRCVSTGRVCDGYGIWGGGGNGYGQRSIEPKKNSGTRLHAPPTSTLIATEEEGNLLEWFKCRTVKKLPGLFKSSFWDTLLLQASSNEPAVLHAVLALSSVHKRAVLDYDNLGTESDTPDRQEQFMLEQYSKSIAHLLPRFSTRSTESIRVALITCMVFISLEFLRGRYNTGKVHLHNGLKLLRETHGCLRTRDRVILISNGSRETTDDWIIEAFFKLHVHVQLLKHTYQNTYFVWGTGLEPPSLTFGSMDHARQRLDRLLDEIFHLNKQGRTYGFSNCPVYPSEVLDHQQRICVELASWLAAYKTSKTSLQAEIPMRDRFAYMMVQMYHTMADIMANTCLWPANEGIYDRYTDKFTSLLIQSIDLWKAHPAAYEVLYGHGVEVAGSIMDRGWIPPLYYMALKCRVHRIRLHAIELLSFTSHKEGIWDSKIAALVARKVVEIEERDFYKDVCEDDHFSVCSHPDERQLLLPPIPESYRIHEAQVLLPDEPTGNLKLLCKQRKEDGSWETLAREYDVPSQCWIDECG